MNNILIGESDFKLIRDSKAYYVDKSLFIEEIVTCPFKVILLTRPRRFGKTINLSLLHYFFDKTDQDHESLFEHLAIKQIPVFKDFFAAYPVIYITFKDIKNVTYAESIAKIARLIQRLLQDHHYLLKWDNLSPVASQLFNKINNNTANTADYEDSIQILSEELERYHNKQVIILIDEYDTPIHTGYIHNYYENMTIFMRNMLGAALKDNTSLYKGVVTGTLRISKESIFTGLNNLGVFPLNKGRFNKCFGFDESEVKKMLADFGLSDEYSTIARWYDGYNFGGRTIFNPWSVVNYISDPDSGPEPYWLNTSSMHMIENVITPQKKLLRKEINDLIEGQSITKIVYENMVFKDITNSRSELVWSFLLHSGYLKVVKKLKSDLRQKYELQIPNREVRIIFVDLAEKWVKNHIDLEQLEILLKSLTQGNISMFERKLKHICLAIMSYHDFAGSPEKVYHALVLGMLVWLSHDYVIRSNRESGFGRYDIIFMPKDKTRQGIIIEFKRIEDNDNVEDVLTDALNQIEEKRYDVELKAENIHNILKLAIGFSSKDVYLKQ
jgi:hypothetical protein